MSCSLQTAAGAVSQLLGWHASQLQNHRCLESASSLHCSEAVVHTVQLICMQWHSINSRKPVCRGTKQGHAFSASAVHGCRLLQAPISVYTSGKGSSAAGLTATVVKDNSGEFFLEVSKQGHHLGQRLLECSRAMPSARNTCIRLTLS